MILAPGRLLTRRDQPAKSTHGWQARIRRRDGTYWSEFFADSRWGGKDGARVRAEIWLTNGGKNV